MPPKKKTSGGGKKYVSKKAKMSTPEIPAPNMADSPNTNSTVNVLGDDFDNLEQGPSSNIADHKDADGAGTTEQAVNAVELSRDDAFCNATMNVNGRNGGPKASTSKAAATIAATSQVVTIDSSDDEYPSSKDKIEDLFRRYSQFTTVSTHTKKKCIVLDKDDKDILTRKTDSMSDLHLLEREMTEEERRNCPTPILGSNGEDPAEADVEVETITVVGGKEAGDEVLHASYPSNSRRATRRNKKNENSINKKTISVPEITISDSDDDDKPTCSKKVGRTTRRGAKKPKGKPCAISSPCLVVEEEEEEEMEEIDLGAMLLFNIECGAEAWPVRLYEKQTVRELRSLIAKKMNVCLIEIPLLYLGTHLCLEDDKTLEESGIMNLCTIEAYMNVKSDKELYDEGSSLVLKLKLQTGDRRGRQDKWVYMKTNKTFEATVAEYAAEIGLPTTGIRISFEGELLNLKSTPADYDLEDEECLDLIIPD